MSGYMSLMDMAWNATVWSRLLVLDLVPPQKLENEEQSQHRQLNLQLTLGQSDDTHKG